MKNPAVASAAVLIALALAVGGFAWMATGTEGSGEGAAVITRTGGETVDFVPISPREMRKKNNLEQARRELHRIRQAGTEVQPGVFKIVDDTGDATYHYGDLIPGKGRDGEPMFLSVQYKRMPAPPLKQRKLGPAGAAKLDTTRRENVLKTGSTTAGGKSGTAGTEAGSDGSDGAGGAGAAGAAGGAGSEGATGGAAGGKGGAAGSGPK